MTGTLTIFTGLPLAMTFIGKFIVFLTLTLPSIYCIFHKLFARHNELCLCYVYTLDIVCIAFMLECTVALLANIINCKYI